MTEKNKVFQKIARLNAYLDTPLKCYKCETNGTIRNEEIYAFRGLCIINVWTLLGIGLFVLMSVLGSRIAIGFIHLRWSYLFTCEAHRILKVRKKIATYFLIFFGLKGVHRLGKIAKKAGYRAKTGEAVYK